MRRICILVAILFAAIVAIPRLHAQAARGRLLEFSVVPENVSPSEIFRRITGLRLHRVPQAQDALDGLNRYVSSLWRELDIPDRWDGRCPVCDGLLIDAQPSSAFTVMRIEVADRQYRFLALVPPSRMGTRWRLARYADTDARYDVPAYRLESLRGGVFLVVEHDTGGTGMYERGDAWYQLAPHADGVALDLPTNGHDELIAVRAAGADFHLLTHEWESNVAHRPDARDNALRVALTARYKLWNGDDASAIEVFTRQQTAAFAWDGAGGRFKFDPAQSDLSEQEFRDVYRAEGMNAEAFARDNAADVNLILDRGTDEEKRAFAALGVRRAR